MKLIGSRAEQQARAELIRSNHALQDGSLGQLVKVLESENVRVVDAYVLDCIPEQSEDIYTVLVPTCEVLIVEVPRGECGVLVERMDLAEYEGKCSKVQRIKIAVARSLLASRAGRPGGSTVNRREI